MPGETIKRERDAVLSEEEGEIKPAKKSLKSHEEADIRAARQVVIGAEAGSEIALQREDSSSSSLDKIDDEGTPTDAASTRALPISLNITLSDNIILSLLQHLGTRDLLACTSVSHRWRGIIQAHPSLWLNKVELRGTLPTVERQWQHLKGIRSELGSPVTVLDIQYSEENTLKMSEETRAYASERRWSEGFLDSLPFDTVERIKYDGNQKDTDCLFYRSLSACTSLKELRFRSRFVRALYWVHDFEYDDLFTFRKDSPISKCQLESIKLEVSCVVYLDNLDLSHLKRLIINTVLRQHKVLRYIQRAANSLEDLHICGTRVEDHRYGRTVDEESSGNCEMEEGCDCMEEDECPGWCVKVVLPNLIRYRSISDHVESNSGWENGEVEESGETYYAFRINAPNVTHFSNVRFIGFDDVLFKSCRRNVQVVHLDVDGVVAKRALEAISEVPKMRKLTLENTTYKTEMIYGPPEGDEMNPFEGDYSSNAVTACMSWINLSNLTLIDCNNITGQEVLRFIQYKRDNSKMTSLQCIDIKACERITMKDVTAMKEIEGLKVLYSTERPPKPVEEKRKTCRVPMVPPPWAPL